MTKDYSFSQAAKVQYSFAPSPASVQPVQAKLVEFSFNEFLLDLPEHWRQVEAPEKNAINFVSEIAEATIIISIDFYNIPPEKQQGVAEQCVTSRHAAYEDQFPGKVEVVHNSIKKHSGGDGLEIGYAVEIPGKHIFFYLGYVTTRKIFNFTLICKPDRMAAMNLFNQTMQQLRPKLP